MVPKKIAEIEASQRKHNIFNVYEKVKETVGIYRKNRQLDY